MGMGRKPAPNRGCIATRGHRITLTSNPTELHFLRIKMADYRAFLQRWVDWLNEEAVETILAEDLGIEQTEAEDSGKAAIEQE